MLQLGTYLLKHGFEVEIIIMNPYLFTKKSSLLSQKALLEYIKKLQEKNKKEPLQHFKEFLETKGKLTVKIPTIQDIQKEIKQKRPLGVLITSNFLLSKKANFNFHFNIITGIDKKYVYVNDPLQNLRGGKQQYEINDFMYALYASAHGDMDNASLLIIKKK